MYNKLMSTPIAIIGAGPAGMTAALCAARQGAQVTLIDGNAQVGRKLLVTGSGRANLTNRAANPERYTCGDPAWLATLFNQFGPKDLIDFLKGLGLLTYSTPDGWFYPVSESAQNVVAVFASALERAGVTLLLDQRVTSIRKSGNGFALDFAARKSLDCDRLLVAAGGKAYPTLGSRGECFPSLKKLGHTVLPLMPALGPISADMRLYHSLQGVRLDAHVTLLKDKQILGETTRNLIFTQWGFNGPAVMDLSHLAARSPNAALTMRMNLLPTVEAEVREQLKLHRKEAGR